MRNGNPGENLQPKFDVKKYVINSVCSHQKVEPRSQLTLCGGKSGYCERQEKLKGNSNMYKCSDQLRAHYH